MPEGRNYGTRNGILNRKIQVVEQFLNDVARKSLSKEARRQRLASNAVWEGTVLRRTLVCLRTERLQALVEELGTARSQLLPYNLSAALGVELPGATPPSAQRSTAPPTNST